MSESPGFKLNNMLPFVPQGHEKALKQAFYNIAAILFVILASAAAIAVYYIMEPFFPPLIWAVLFGSVLHPIKQKCTDVVKMWFSNLQASGTPFCIGFITFPIAIIDKTSENFLYLVFKFWKIALCAIISGILIVFTLCLLPYNFLFSSFLFLKNLIVALLTGIMSIMSLYMVMTIVVAYLLVILFFWNLESKPILEKMSLPIWLIVLLYLTTIAGPLREPLLYILLILVLVGFATNKKLDRHNKDTEDEQTSHQTFSSKIKEKMHSLLFNENHVKPSAKKDDDSSDATESDENNLTEELKKKKLQIKLKLAEEKLSNMYLYGLFVLCICVQLWLHVFVIISIISVMIFYMILKYLGYRFGLWSFMSNKAADRGSWFGDRENVLLPGPIKGVWSLILKGDAKCMEYIDGTIDETISILVIVMMFLFAICTSIFISVQLYSESAHLVDLTGNLINRTIVYNPELREMLPAGIDEEIQNGINSAMDNAYKYGRNYTLGIVRSIIQEEDEEKCKAIEKQVLDLIDNLYHAWMTRNDTTKPSSDQISIVNQSNTFDKLLEGLKKPGVLNLNFITEFAKENLGIFMSILDSFWMVLRGNFSLVINILTATFSLLFVGGTAVLNFVMNSIIFLTALVYLLCASGQQYKPVELAGSMLPSTGGTVLGEAFNEAVNSVFAATFKRAIFYGMYTWLIHTVLAVQIIYIPSVLASVLGAIPFLGTYWACFPAIIELWLVNRDIISAVLMIVLSFLPMAFVDNAINAEIKSGHPYLTALAIAGGMFCLGMQGALIGPILLCLLSVVFKMYGSFMSDTPDSETAQRRRSLKR